MSTDTILALPYRERLKLMQERLHGLTYAKVKPLTKPNRVVLAEKVVSEWEAKNEKHEEAQRVAHRKALNEIRDAMILGDAKRAVELMRKLEAANDKT